MDAIGGFFGIIIFIVIVFGMMFFVLQLFSKATNSNITYRKGIVATPESLDTTLNYWKKFSGKEKEKVKHSLKMKVDNALLISNREKFFEMQLKLVGELFDEFHKGMISQTDYELFNDILKRRVNEFNSKI